VKRNALALSARIALLGAALWAAAALAQEPQSPPPAAAPGSAAQPPHGFPAPTNLQVLPKDLTGGQVIEIMRGWAGDLGVRCDTCHAVEAASAGSNGRPRMNFAADEKDDKLMARIMYQMLEEDKKNYIARVADMDKMGASVAPLTCGTCHRGHLDPEAYASAPEHPPQSAPGSAPATQPQ
jgi:hypothetical protein